MLQSPFSATFLTTPPGFVRRLIGPIERVGAIGRTGPIRPTEEAHYNSEGHHPRSETDFSSTQVWGGGGLRPRHRLHLKRPRLDGPPP